MAFFGVESSGPIEDEKRRFLAGAGGGGAREDEDIAVYNWGADDYDGLGNALQEGGDDLNDETFGGNGPVGKDFDFASHALPDTERRPNQSQTLASGSALAQAKQPQQARPTHTSRESIWDDKSPFSVLRTSSSIGRRAGSALSGTGSGGGSAHGHQASPSLSASGAGAGTGLPTRASNANALRQQAQSPASHSQLQAPLQQQNVDGMVNYSAPGMRSLAEIEAEMRAATLKAREQKMQEQLLLQQQQQQQAQQAQQVHQQQQQFLQQQHTQQHQVQNQAQHLTKPPRMRSQSPSTHTHQHPHQHQQHALPMNAPQAGYQIPPQVMDTYRQQQQQGLLHEVESLRLQEAIRAHRKDGSADLSIRNNNTHTPIDPVEYVLHKSAERERERERGVPQGMNMGVNMNMNMGIGMGLPHGRSPALPQPQPQPRFDEFDYAPERARPLHGAAEDFHALRRHIVAEQQQRRASPMDALQHQMRLALANEMASKARGESGTPGIGGGGLGVGIGGGAGGTGAAAQEHAQLQQYLQQQRMLAQLAQQQEFATQGLNGVSRQELLPAGATNSQREHLQVEAMRKIMEAEKQEGRRRRKAQKIAHMSRYNDLMTQSDKDFITRIQVSQLVTSDPYTEDFYAQVYGSLMRSRMGMSAAEERVLKFGSGEGVGLGLNQRGGNRRPNAMQRMEAQVERIVNNARQREKEKGLHAIHSLQGALGKTAGRSYKAAPRQLLQVDSNGAAESAAPNAHGHISKDDSKENAADAAKEAAKRGREALGVHADPAGTTRKDPLTRRECLVILESLYDSQLRIEQLRREQPPAEDEANMEEWKATYKSETSHLWDSLRVMVPLETSDPHPFISLLMPAKGKKLLPRLTRHLSTQQLLQVICLLVACFSQLDVVKNAGILDMQEDTHERAEVDRQTQTFLSTVLQSILPVIAQFNLGVVVGMMGLLMEHCDMGLVVHSRPGQSLLTAFLSRAEVIKSEMMAGSIDQSEIPSEEDLQSWQGIILHLYHIFGPYLLSLFPSSRIPTLRTPAGVSTMDADLLDQPVWKFLATFALHADNEQQQVLVSTLREKILDNVLAVNKGFVTDEAEQTLKITNVNIFLHALGLDSSQISV